MKKNLILSAVLALCGAFSLSAEVLSPYAEHFENPTFRPKGWTNSYSSSYYKATYTAVEEGGKEGGYISAKQYSTNYFSSYYGNYSYTDLLITPPVSGTVSLWVRKADTAPSLTYYAIVDGVIPSSYAAPVLVEGTVINMVADLDVDDWTEIKLEDVPEGTVIGIRAHNLDLDEFSATSATVTYQAGLLATVTNQTVGNEGSATSYNCTLEANEDNEVTIKFNVSIQNTGDIDFPESEEGFKVELVNRALNNKVCGTGKITEAIPCGQTVSKDFEMTFEPEKAPNVYSETYDVILTHEKTGSVTASLKNFIMIPYKPIAKLMFNEDNYKNQSSYNDVNIVDVINVGVGAAGTSRTLWLWNSGPKPMTVSALDFDGDFESDATLPFTVNKDEKKAINVSLKGDAGLKNGKIKFTANDIDSLEYLVQGIVTAEGKYFEDFEAETTPVGMIVGNSWKHNNAADALKTLAGNKYMELPYASTNDRFITPLLSFEEGEQLSFIATKKDNTSSYLRIYTSTDRVNWTPVDTIDTRKADATRRFRNDKPTGTGYGTYEFGAYSMPMPTGNCYVAFEAGGVIVDNIYGGKAVPVKHDLYVTDKHIPDAGSVNANYMVDITVKNILATAESNYLVSLEFDGEEVAECEDTPAIASGESATFTFRFVPHTQGEFNAAIVLKTIKERVVLYEYTATIEEEKTEAVYQVGNYKITTTDPINAYYNACQTQIVYTADRLNMDEGVKITGFSFIGYNTAEITKNIKVWVENTDSLGYNFKNIIPAEKDSMTLVFDGQYTFPVAGVYAQSKWETTFQVVFDTPITYTGKSLRVMIQQTTTDESTDNDSHVFFCVDNSAYNYYAGTEDNKVIKNTQDYVEDLEDEARWVKYVAGYPVTYFTVAKDVVTVKGTVKDEIEDAVADAVVEFVSGEILYTATTKEDGTYSVNIANVDLVYNMTATAEGYDKYENEEVTLDKTQDVNVFDVTFNFTERSATLEGHVINILEDNAPVEGAVVTLGDQTATTDEFGFFSITAPEFTDEYTLTVVHNEVKHHESTFKFTSNKLHTKDIEVSFSGIEGVSVDAKAAVSVVANTIVVKAAAGAVVNVYNAAGITVATAVSDGAALTFGPLTAGVYIVEGAKVVIK